MYNFIHEWYISKSQILKTINSFNDTLKNKNNIFIFFICKRFGSVRFEPYGSIHDPEPNREPFTLHRTEPRTEPF